VEPAPKEKKRKPAHKEKQEKKKDDGLSKSDQAALNKLLASLDTSAQSPDLQQASLAVATEPGMAAEGSQAKSAYA
ncbi:hypothetical protein Q2421_24945, partial [Escherichia coli]|nr:hypothetical protein [Escherichia coli]